jgi:5-dehydro-2-deoxygluconokinase
MGCVVFPDAIPASIEEGVKGPGFPVEVFNTLGAGDGFMSGFLRGFLRDQPLEECARFGNACGAIVVSRHGCCPASPSWVELQHFLDHGSPHFRLREDPVLNHIHRATTRTGKWPEVLALAFDHRAQLEELADRAGAARERIAAFKLLIAEAAREAAGAAKVEHPGILVDGRYGLDVLEQMAASGWWIGRPIELPGSRPLEFEGGPNVASTLRGWPAEHVVKCLVFYHPDDPDDLRAAQDRQLQALYEACEQTRHELLLEVISPKRMPAGPDTLARALERIYGQGVYPDWWKLPPPDAAGWDAIEEVIERHDPYCRGVLLLGLEAPLDALRRDFAVAAGRRWCKGFAVGRSIFGAPAKAWLAGAMSDQDAVTAMARIYRELINLWRSH